jgi:hypothetical protein
MTGVNGTLFASRERLSAGMAPCPQLCIFTKILNKNVTRIGVLIFSTDFFVFVSLGFSWFYVENVPLKNEQKTLLYLHC